MPDSKRQERLRLALRANLRKRKAQTRARQEESPEEESPAENGAGASEKKPVTP